MFGYIDATKKAMMQQKSQESVIVIR